MCSATPSRYAPKNGALSGDNLGVFVCVDGDSDRHVDTCCHVLNKSFVSAFVTFTSTG